MLGRRIQWGKRTTAMVGLLALVLLQFSSAGHQFDHAISDAQETCGFCVQLDRNGDSPVAQSLHIPPFVADAVDARAETVSVSAVPFYRYKSRGPPSA